MNPNYLAVLEALTKLPPATAAPSLALPPGPRPDTLAPPLSLTLPTPEPPPMAPSMPIDRSVIDRYLALLGPAPTPPGQNPIGKLERIAMALQGFSAGMQGQGPQFLAGLREQRERPQREFEQQKAQYDQQKVQLGLRGLEAAQSAEEKRQARQQAEADRQFEIDVQQRARQLGFQDQVAIEKLREAMQTERQREAERIADEKQQAAFDQQLKIEKGKLRKAFLDQGAGRYADELASYALGQIDTLSPGAEKANLTIQAKIAALQRRASGGGSGSGGGAAAGRLMTWAELSDGSVVPADKVKLVIIPPGVQVKRLFSTGIPGQQTGGAATGGEGPVTDEEIKEARTAGVPESVIKQEIARRGRAKEAAPVPAGAQVYGPSTRPQAPKSYPAGVASGGGFQTGRGQ